MDALDFDLIPIPAEREAPTNGWRPPAEIRMISADDHNQEMEHLFEERLPARFKDRAPKVWRDKATGLWHTEIFGRSYDTPGVGTIGDSLPGYWDPDERVRYMTAEGIEGSVLYHGQLQVLNAIMGEDPELYAACMEAYNEWLADYTRPHADKLVGVAMLPSFLKPETARDQMQKIEQLGFRSVQMPSYPKGVRYNSREMDPLWSAIVESGIPLSFHVTALREFSGWGSLGANISRNLSPFRPLLGQLIFSGVFERHPDLRVVFAEGGIAWVADALYSMDKICRAYYTVLKPQLPHLPSFYWKRQCLATFMDDRIGVQLIDRIGEDNVMWSLDFPHPEGVFGFAGDIAKGIYDTIGHDRAKKVLGGTAARLYRL
jgi:predicted TIM-barrel fold metal-dependent hydrolase